MITSEVLKHYEDGGKIRKTRWVTSNYIDKNNTCEDTTYGSLNEILKKCPDWMMHDWEIYQEPKKRIITVKELFEAGATHIKTKEIISAIIDFHPSSNTILVNDFPEFDIEEDREKTFFKYYQLNKFNK